MFPSLTAGQISEISTGAWTYNTPWVTDWLAFDSSAASNSSEHQLFAGAVTPEAPGTTGWDGAGYDNSTDAYNEAINDGDYNKIVTGTGRYTGTVQSSYTFAAPQTLIFVVADYDVGDNAGSVSVLATPVPEPVTLGFFAMSALALRLRTSPLARMNSAARGRFMYQSRVRLETPGPGNRLAVGKLRGRTTLWREHRQRWRDSAAVSTRPAATGPVGLWAWLGG